MERNHLYENLIKIIRSEIFGDTFSIESYSQIDVKSVYLLSVKHDISNVVSSWGKKQDCLPEKTKLLFNQNNIVSIYRHEKMNLYLSEISKLFDSNNIKYIPLKGAIIKNLYDTPHYRTSCDIDILIQEQDLARAISVIKENFKPISIQTLAHDVSIYLEQDIHLELHFSLNELHDKHDKITKNPWEHVIDSQNCKKEFTNEFFVAYFITHMAHHFLEGGCGIRPFIDLYIINKKMPYDKEKTYNILKIGNLTKFADVMFELSEIWFGDGKHNDLTLQIEEYIIAGGVYGSKEQSVEVKNATNGKGKFILKRIFMPYNDLCVAFPILKKVAILYPFCLVVRWFQILFSKRIKNATKEIKISAKVDNEKIKQSKKMLEELQL